MKQTISMNRREVERLYELFNLLHESGDHGYVTLCQEGDNGIGNGLTATFVITHNEIDGEFTTTITDEEDW